MIKDYYITLQVHSLAEPEVIVAAYKGLVKKYHPDVYKAADATDRMKDINEAYDVLSNPARRAAYDTNRSHSDTNKKRTHTNGRSEDTCGQDATTYRPVIYNLAKLRDAIAECTTCRTLRLSKNDFNGAVLINKLEDGYYVYHLSHPWGGQHLYVTSVPKSENFESSYHNISLAYAVTVFAQEGILDIVKQLRSS